ncbi:MAG: PA0069 family radical SAM protein [Phycisphaeraceae bacterium]|nr:PA0069 family radical SAM protein [Phycisphaerales bacterium]MCB9859437.1 PA0069 family radical SAM protein [Phycisphaeraceae bacterium]
MSKPRSATPTNQPDADHAYADAITGGLARGRGSQINPGNRFDGIRLHVLGEFLDEEINEADGTSTQHKTKVIADATRTIINRVDAPDIPFMWTINPYRGCEHGCTYCYARPTHENLGMSCGLDFETKIVAKFDAPDLLRKELAKSTWACQPIVMSGVTDAYQPIERKLRITRGILEVLTECKHPISIITKNALIQRDIDLLSQLAKINATRVAISLTSLDPHLTMKMEPRTASPKKRLETIRALSDAGVPVIVMTAPMIPAINDRELPSLLEAAADAGAVGAGYTLVRLPWQVEAIFVDWLKREFPDRARHVESLLRQSRNGNVVSSNKGPNKGARMGGEGAFAQIIRDTFKRFQTKYGLDQTLPKLNTSAFERPFYSGSKHQLGLFG